jgi:hypothetical protein
LCVILQKQKKKLLITHQIPKIKFQVAGVAATTEHSPSAPTQGTSTLQLSDDSHMSLAAAENAG